MEIPIYSYQILSEGRSMQELGGDYWYLGRYIGEDEENS
jgi:hypothetical protein